MAFEGSKLSTLLWVLEKIAFLALLAYFVSKTIRKAHSFTEYVYTYIKIFSIAVPCTN